MTTNSEVNSEEEGLLPVVAVRSDESSLLDELIGISTSNDTLAAQ